MLTRAALVLTALFCAGMTAWLWQNEYGARPAAGAGLPADIVWRKMLLAPDSSSLTIYRHGKKIGFCHWTSTAGQALAEAAEEGPPPAPQAVTSYRVQLEGSVSLDRPNERLRFESQFRLATNYVWQTFKLRLALHPSVLEVQSAAADQKLAIRWRDGDASFERVLPFSELRNPAALAGELGGPPAIALLQLWGLPQALGPGQSLRAGLKWEARNDHLVLHNSQVRVYRLHARILDQFEAVLYISRVGEILRAELPGGIVLVNDLTSAF